MDMMTTIGLPKELYGALLDAAVLTSIETRKLWKPSNGAWLCRWLASDAPEMLLAQHTLSGKRSTE